MTNSVNKTTTTKDMTDGPILTQILQFALPLMVGNIFQMLYNTVDSVVVGNFVSTEALAAVGSTTMITNMAVFFFNGFSVGAGVVIGRFFGARQERDLHKAVETTMATTFLFCLIFTIVFTMLVEPMLRFMSTPDDVFADATVYLRIYFLGITGLLIYNMGSGILRAVGDSKRPLYFLILTSIMNIFLDLFFVLVLHMGIAGVAIATIIAQMISAILILVLLMRTTEIYRFTLHDMRIDLPILGQIFAIGLPNGIQSIITAFSNIFVQSYINYFGSTAMAGWSCYNKIDSFIMLPMSSMAMAATTFVSQNVGAQKLDRVNKGTKVSLAVTLSITFVIATLIYIFAGPSTALFTEDQGVIEYGILFLHTNVYFLMFNCINHVLAGSLRGRGDSTGPMVIMISCFVVVRQIYLFTITNYFINEPAVVGFGYPVGWASCCVVELLYFFLKWNRKETRAARA